MVRVCTSHRAHRVSRWLSDESGAVTTDWVVLTAGIVGLALAAMSSISGGAQQHAAHTSVELANRDLGVN